MYADMKQTLERLDAAPNGSVGGSKKRDEDRDPLLSANAPGPAHGNGGPARPLSGWRLQARRAAFTALDLCVAGVDIFIVVLGPILALLASSLFSFIIYVYFTEVLPGLLVSRGTVMAQLITLLGLWIVFNLFFNYLRAMFVGPGSSPAELDDATRAALVDDPELTTPGAQHRFCGKCQRVKPMRAHHCSICKKCVLRFDHHCPWINNCVGHKNLRHFFLFLFYLWSGSAFFLITSAGDAVHALLGVMDSASFLIAVVLSFSAFIATSCFLAWNVYLIVTNQSTVEFSGAIFKRKGIPNPFDHGFHANWRSVFGDDGVWTFWLPTLKPPPGNGYVFPVQRRGVSHII